MAMLIRSNGNPQSSPKNFPIIPAIIPMKELIKITKKNISIIILNLPQQIKESAFFKSVGSLNYTSLKIENEIHTHEDALRRQLVPHFVRNINTDLKENSSRSRSCFFEAPEFSQIGFADFFKSNIKRNFSFGSQARFN